MEMRHWEVGHNQLSTPVDLTTEPHAPVNRSLQMLFLQLHERTPFPVAATCPFPHTTRHRRVSQKLYIALYLQTGTQHRSQTEFGISLHWCPSQEALEWTNIPCGRLQTTSKNDWISSTSSTFKGISQQGPELAGGKFLLMGSVPTEQFIHCEYSWFSVCQPESKPHPQVGQE